MATPDYTIDQSKQTVQGQLDNLISQDNPLMKKAKAAGTQYANQRGLLNSSIGAGATQSAMMDYAMPIAQTDAATYNQFASQKYGTDLQKDVNQQAQDFTQANMKLTNSLGQSDMKLADSLQQGQMNLANQLEQSNMGLSQKYSLESMDQANTYDQSNMNLQAQLAEKQAAADYARQLGQMDKAASIEKDMAALQNTYSTDQMKLQADLNNEVTAKTTAANTQGEYLNAIDEIVNNAMVSINEIETAEGIDQDEKNTMIENTIKRRDADLAFTKSLYSNMPTWDFSWVDIADNAMPSAPGVTA